MKMVMIVFINRMTLCLEFNLQSINISQSKQKMNPNHNSVYFFNPFQHYSHPFYTENPHLISIQHSFDLNALQFFSPNLNSEIFSYRISQNQMPQVEQSRVTVEQESNKKNKRSQNQQKEIESAKKNAESNIVNQMLAFFSNNSHSELLLEKSVITLGKSPEQEKKILKNFAKIIKCSHSMRSRRYSNKQTILNLCFGHTISRQIPKITEILTQLQCLAVEEFCEVFRKCCFQYMRESSIMIINVSRRISKRSRVEHLIRRRKILKCIENHILGKE